MSFEQGRKLREAFFSPDGSLVISVSQRGSLSAWDTTTGELVYECPHRDRITDAAFTPDGTRLVTVSSDATAAVWDGYSGAPLGVADATSVPHRGHVSKPGD